MPFNEERVSWPHRGHHYCPSACQTTVKYYGSIFGKPNRLAPTLTAVASQLWRPTRLATLAEANPLRASLRSALANHCPAHAPLVLARRLLRRAPRAAALRPSRFGSVVATDNHGYAPAVKKGSFGVPPFSFLFGVAARAPPEAFSVSLRSRSFWLPCPPPCGGLRPGREPLLRPRSGSLGWGAPHLFALGFLIPFFWLGGVAALWPPRSPPPRAG